MKANLHINKPTLKYQNGILGDSLFFFVCKFEFIFCCVFFLLHYFTFNLKEMNMWIKLKLNWRYTLNGQYSSLSSIPIWKWESILSSIFSECCITHFLDGPLLNSFSSGFVCVCNKNSVQSCPELMLLIKMIIVNHVISHYIDFQLTLH